MPPPGRPHLAIELWGFTHRKDLVEAPAPLLAQLAAIGYAGYEAQISPGLDAMVRGGGGGAGGTKSGQRCAALHLVTGRLVDEVDTVIAEARRFGVTTVITSGPIAWFGRTRDDWDATVRVLDAAGRRLATAGIRLLYHNHEFEFAPLPDGAKPFDLLVAGCAPGVCDFCIDVGWVWFAGADPVAVLRALGDRVRFLHLRDFAGRTSVALGEGRMPLADIVKAAPATLDWLVVEQDPVSADPVADAGISLRWLKAALSAA